MDPFKFVIKSSQTLQILVPIPISSPKRSNRNQNQRQNLKANKDVRQLLLQNRFLQNRIKTQECRWPWLTAEPGGFRSLENWQKCKKVFYSSQKAIKVIKSPSLLETAMQQKALKSQNFDHLVENDNYPKNERRPSWWSWTCTYRLTRSTKSPPPR